jgi:hypothetical protein
MPGTVPSTESICIFYPRRTAACLFVSIAVATRGVAIVRTRNVTLLFTPAKIDVSICIEHWQGASFTALQPLTMYSTALHSSQHRVGHAISEMTIESYDTHIRKSQLSKC